MARELRKPVRDKATAVGIEAIPPKYFFSLASTSTAPLSRRSVFDALEVHVKSVWESRETIPIVVPGATTKPPMSSCGHQDAPSMSNHENKRGTFVFYIEHVGRLVPSRAAVWSGSAQCRDRHRRRNASDGRAPSTGTQATSRRTFASPRTQSPTTEPHLATDCRSCGGRHRWRTACAHAGPVPLARRRDFEVRRVDGGEPDGQHAAADDRARVAHAATIAGLSL